MIWNPAKLVAILICTLFWVFLALFFFGCANVDKVQEKEGWFPVGMDEDAQSFYNTKYNMIDNGQDEPSAKIKVFNTKF
jgi:PBP1b-binding outer membrane lipoprotein LpoB